MIIYHIKETIIFNEPVMITNKTFLLSQKANEPALYFKHKFFCQDCIFYCTTNTGRTIDFDGLYPKSVVRCFTEYLSNKQDLLTMPGIKVIEITNDNKGELTKAIFNTIPSLEEVK